mmetsp:Transcript_15640/g.36909  ORF Transcript_15640/g.36909 Transcript_15640/m.36909 type:complete len:335 (+) Transcript_15640:1323-2327(+)
MAGVGAAAIEGGVAASCDALKVEAASVVHRRASIGDGVDTVRKRHGGRGIPTEAHARVCLLHLSLSWHSVWVLARGLRVVSAAGLRIPLHAPGRRLRVRHAAQAAHGLVGELLHGGRVQDPRQDGAKQDHDHHGRPHAQEDQQAHEAEESDADPRAQEVLSGQRHEVHQHSRMIPHDVDAVARLQADEGQKQADACHRGLHHPCREDLEDVAPNVKGRHEDEDHALDRHCQHHLLHCVLPALEAHDGVGEVSIHAHTRPKAKGQIRPERHDQRGHAAGRGRGEDEAVEVQPGGAQDVRVHGHDVGGREKGRDPGTDLGREIGASLGHPEVLVHF